MINMSRGGEIVGVAGIKRNDFSDGNARRNSFPLDLIDQLASLFHGRRKYAKISRNRLLLTRINYFISQYYAGRKLTLEGFVSQFQLL
jgi:hypothetical protein